MRIGFGATALAKGIASGHVDGIGVYTRSLLEALDTLRLETTVVNFGRCQAFAAHDPFPNYPNTCLPLSYPAAMAFSLLTSLPFPCSNKLLNEIDLFHAPDHHIPRLSKIPIIATVMDAIPLVHPEWASKRLRTFKNAAFRQMARSARRIITISEYSKADIVHYFGIPAERVSVTYLGVNPAYAQPVAPEMRQAVLQRYGLEAGFFIFVGTIQPRKNVARIIEAHRMLPKEMLARRMKPALRTCVTTEARQSSLSLKLARAANLLRTRVDVELEQQNQELLKSMNARTRLQLRLQTTVEGLSVAAITYYVVGLFGYLVKAAHDSGRMTIEPSIITAAFVPIAALAIWWTVRRIRRKHTAGED